MYSRWKTHKWRKCQLVPWFLRQNSAGAQETCGPGLQTRGIETNLFISPSSLHLHWTIANHHKLNLCSLRCIWSPATRQQMDVPRFRKKANLLRAHIKSSHLQDSAHLEADTPKNISKRLFSDCFYFLVFSRVWKGCVLTTHHMPLETCLTVLVVSLLAFFSPRALVMQF